MGHQAVSFVERSIILCPYLRGSTVHKHNHASSKLFVNNRRIIQTVVTSFTLKV